jgi:hypothetical protein
MELHHVAMPASVKTNSNNVFIYEYISIKLKGNYIQCLYLQFKNRKTLLLFVFTDAGMAT